MNGNNVEVRDRILRLIEDAYDSPIRQRIEEDEEGEITKIPGGMCMHNTADLIRMLVNDKHIDIDDVKMLVIFPQNNTNLIVDPAILSDDEKKVVFFRRFLGLPYNWVFHVVAEIKDEIVDFSLDKEHYISSKTSYFDRLSNSNHWEVYPIDVEDIDEIVAEMDRIQDTLPYDISKLKYKAQQLQK